MTASTGVFLEAALRYADLGYPVFPCAPGAKKPVTRRGFHAATADPGKIERMWHRHPTANVAIATGGLLVVDCRCRGGPLAGRPGADAGTGGGAAVPHPPGRQPPCLPPAC